MKCVLCKKVFPEKSDLLQGCINLWDLLKNTLLLQICSPQVGNCSSKTFITLRYLSVHPGFKIFIAASTFFPFDGFHKLRYTRDIPPWPSFFWSEKLKPFKLQNTVPSTFLSNQKTATAKCCSKMLCLYSESKFRTLFFWTGTIKHNKRLMKAVRYRCLKFSFCLVSMALSVCPTHTSDAIQGLCLEAVWVLASHGHLQLCHI